MHISAASEVNNLLLPSLEALRVRLLSRVVAQLGTCRAVCFAALLRCDA